MINKNKAGLKQAWMEYQIHGIISRKAFTQKKKSHRIAPDHRFLILLPALFQSDKCLVGWSINLLAPHGVVKSIILHAMPIISKTTIHARILLKMNQNYMFQGSHICSSTNRSVL